MPDEYLKGNLPNVEELGSPDGFQGWKRKMERWLTAADVYQYCEEDEYKDPPTAEIPTLKDDGSNKAEVTEAQKDLKEELKTWTRGNKMARNAILARLKSNYIKTYEKETSAYKIWHNLIRDCKPRGAGTLNEYYWRLGAITLASCKDVPDYIGQFKDLCEDIDNVHPVLLPPASYLIFLFYTGLGKDHQQYFTSYTQDHQSIEGDEIAYTLDYTTNRFQ